MTYATNNLFISQYGRPWAPYRDFNLLAMLRLEMPWDLFHYNRWMSLALSWWFVLAVAEKFGNKPKVVCPVEEECLNNEEPDVSVNGYVIDKNLTWQTLLSLTSDDRYWDHHNYFIVGFRNRHFDMETWCAWNSDLDFDAVVLTQGRPLGENTSDPRLVDVNIQLVPFRMDNTFWDQQECVFFVGASTPNRPDDFMRMAAAIRFPDPIASASTVGGVVARAQHDMADTPHGNGEPIANATDPSVASIEELR